MAVEILPAIIEDTYEEVEKKLKLVAPLVDWVQVDIGDGEFVGHRTWLQVEDLASASASLNIDLHIMVHDPQAYAARAVKVNCVRRITFHLEATADPLSMIEEIRRSGREAGIALNPATAIEGVAPLLKSVDAVLVMGVNPGWGGQGFMPETPARVAALKTMSRGLPIKIGVDGGIHLASGSAQAAVDAGADYLVVGSDIFSTPNPGDAIKRLKDLRPSVSKSQ